MSESQALVLVKAGDYAIMAPGAGDSMAGVMANIGAGGLTEFDLDRVKVPAAGGLTWQIPGLHEAESKSVDGVIVAWRDPHSFWREGVSTTGGGAPPDCYSHDGIVGIGKPGGECVTCPNNAWGSANRDG